MASIYSIRCCDIASAKVQKKDETLGLFGRKYYFCTMNERIAWVDWGKALAAVGIVFIHLPQSQQWFYYRYLQAVVVVVFFFMSGYLKRERGSSHADWRKYFRSLIVPYFLYNAIIYPYWWVKYYLQHGSVPDMLAALKPVIGTLLLQHNSQYAEPLDGPLWYLPAILAMHLTIDLCRKTRHQHVILTTLCLISCILYAANKYWYFAPDLTPMGLMRNLPFYYIGYLFAQYHVVRHVNTVHGLAGCLSCFAVSLLCFQWHLQCYYAGQHLRHIILFYPVCLAFLAGVLYACLLLERYTPALITNLSLGTLVTVGFHIVLITACNFAIEYTINLHQTYCYRWYEALPMAVFISALLYPLIIFAKKHAPILLGK